MNLQKLKQQNKARLHRKVRAKIQGTSERPRLTVFRSNLSMYVQVIDDEAGKTIVSAHTKELKKKVSKIEQALELGKLIASKVKDKKIKTVVFDRSSYRYHGRVKAVAEGAREGGLEF